MKKAVTTVLVTGATIAGVAGVLVLNPRTPSLTAGTGTGTQVSPDRAQLRGASGAGQARPALPNSGSDPEGESEEHGSTSSGSTGSGSVSSGSSSSGSSSSGSSGSGSSSSGSSASGSASSGSGSGSSSSGSTSTSTKTYTGSSYSSPYGPMQVSISVAGGKISDIQWQQVPMNDGHSARINSYAAPLLVQQALAAQSATVDGVSGASYTTEGFRMSLQSAIQKAGL
ncbi:FMN-binding domain-containing protein [Raineyella antarctica]|uniref:FMN-binding domain-containing protein n=1 Tax=Raineyella antarctica TaxID=1577474 RepID=A0A1G6H963_9ACTN|nr:FMN-binding protein [Raineyella antarctica]SDB90638.1 FMN-binding domain-containing protein [Raineyella antarctica]